MCTGCLPPAFSKVNVAVVDWAPGSLGGPAEIPTDPLSGIYTPVPLLGASTEAGCPIKAFAMF